MEVLANKYRPKKIVDLIGQDSVIKILTNTILSGNLHHAYIFAGKFGCGKTTSARIFAASVNNKKGMTLDPDLSDPNLQAIYDGKSVDILEFDAGSKGKIEEIRDLKEQIQYVPLHNKYRFVIIDEAHRLTGAAAEAALKMIEEPPANCIFILCTTNPEDLKDTIQSRCMTLRFNKVSWDQLFNNLVKVAQSEGIKYEDTALRIAAKLSKGSVRNSLQNLQTLMTYANGGTITSVMAQECLAAIDENKYFDLIASILKPDAGEAMRIIDGILSDGREVSDMLDGLMLHVRNLLLIRTVKDTSKLLFLTEDEKKKYSVQSQSLSIPLLMHMIDDIVNVSKAINFNVNPQTMLEKFVISSIIYSRTEAKSTA